MKKQPVNFILITIFCTVFLGCEGMATLFHGPKPEAPTVTYTVTFNANGATGTAPAARTVNNGALISLPDKGGLNRTGYVFTGWNESPGGSNTTYSVGASVAVTRDMVFYAQWLDSSTPQYTVTFNANGATGTPPTSQTVYSGDSITIPGQGTLAYSGKTFGGWNTQADGGGTNYAAGALFTVTGDVILYAKWGDINSGSATVPGANLTAKFSWLQTNAESGGNYIVEADTSGGFGPTTLSYSGKNNISITLKSAGATQTISLSANGSMFTVNSGVTLILENITLQGRSDNNGPLVRINTGGSFTMSDGTISGNSSNSSNSSGGGVAVYYGGIFTMNGGIISGNSIFGSNYNGGGGVRVNGGTFTMNNGIISDNNAYEGGGVYVYDGTFTMSGGTISDNTWQTSSNDGGGVYVEGGSFIMSGGNISTNIAAWGGGVYMSGGIFTMSGGIVSGNIARASGGGVQVRNGVFTKNGGTITGFTDNPGNGNVVMDIWDRVLSNRGHAVYAGIGDNDKRMESTAGPTVNLSYDGSGDYPTWNGDWEY